ncbi:MAG: succinate dehydrogenase, cytochrome b556 subunit [Steroidobacteraceae bacterium]|nr:succinate dehydrogenase, cytochrome b556 subunit [Steroidobacteraceae bacterium]MDW8259460.1 succinate dehydrogenase, cytochrome b556 subunit [Gammaproteobacteria bacterium]
MRSRPLSPHLTVYRFGYTMSMSIAHRICGLGLSAGLLLLVWWLMALATGPVAYQRAMAWLGHPLMKLALALWLLSFVYHLANGIRHLTWDMGVGLERHESRRSAWVTLGVVVVLFAVLLGGFLWAGGRA